MIKATKDLIRLLPFDDQFKSELESKYDHLGPDQKYNIDSALWDTYDALYEVRLEENIQLGLLHVKEGKDTLDDGFYRRIREKTEREMQTQEAVATTHINLHETRKKLQELIKAQSK